MVKPLAFKGDKKPNKRKAPHPGSTDEGDSKMRTLQSIIAANSEEDDSWVTAEAPTDIIGPVILILPSAEPTCIACDANGKVFASKLENIVEGDVATAEPHDVRQVFIACSIAGTEHISFKGHHGRYLSCDMIGVLSATREAISPEESFLCNPCSEIPGTFSIRTVREKFFAMMDERNALEIRGDAELVSFNTRLQIRMQARFKPRLKADKQSKIREKVSRKELEEAVGRKLDDVEVRRLKKARVQGDYHEVLLDVRVKGKHDKYS